jgi:hypothetical protein
LAQVLASAPRFLIQPTLVDKNAIHL